MLDRSEDRELNFKLSHYLRPQVFYVAASLGFEPRQRDPESLVLPLHHEANERKIKAERHRFASERHILAAAKFEQRLIERKLRALARGLHFQALAAGCGDLARVFHHRI